jgi:signal transduction histidine kinase
VRLCALLTLGLTLGASAPLPALSPARALSQYAVMQWDAASGLPGDSVLAIHQARDRYLWLGTSAGLVRFDGARFRLAGSPASPGFGDGGVSALTEGPGGALYVGTTSGALLRHQNATFTPLRFKFAGNETTPMRSLIFAKDGALWIGAENWPVYRYAGGPMLPAPPGLTETRGALTVLAEGERGLWIAVEGHGLLSYADDEATPVLADPTLRIQALLADPDGSLWIGTPHGLGHLRSGPRGLAGNVVWTGVREGLSHPNVTALARDHDGNVWIGTARGLNRWREGRIETLTRRDGLANDDVRCLHEDDEGNLWIGTTRGLVRLSDPPFITYGPLQGLPDVPVRGVAPGRDGTVWIGLDSGDVARVRGEVVERVALPPGPAPCGVILMYADRAGRVWVSRDDGRLFGIEGGRVSDETPLDLPSTSTRASAVFEDDEGLVFFIRPLGLVRLRGRHVVPLSRHGAETEYVTQIHRTADGTLWMCGLRGLLHVRGEQTTIFPAARPAPADVPSSGSVRSRVRGLVEDEDGAFWLAASAGLGRFEGGAVSGILTTGEGLPENYLRLVLDDGHGFLWLASRSRVFRVAKAQARDVLAGRRARVDPLAFDISDGLSTTEALVSSSPGFRANDGRIWLATTKGVSVVDPARVAADRRAPTVVIESVTVDGDSHRRDEYAPGRGEVTIEYTSLAFRFARRIRFRHRLDGLDRGWVEAGTARRAYYSNLPPADYSFAVMASDENGDWTEPAVTLPFRIRPHFYETRLFHAAAVALLAALALAAHRVRLAQTRARLGAIIHERTRIARELHDTLAQSLAGMSLQMEAALDSLPETPPASRTRRHLELARSMVGVGMTEVRRSIWVLRAQTSLGSGELGAMLAESLSQLTADAGIALTLDVAGEPRAMAPEMERDLLRIAHEAVINAVRHARAATISARLQFVADGVRLDVRDDGCGFDPVAAKAGEHFGLVGMSERARLLGGELHIVSHVGDGTAIECRLPYKSRRVSAGEGAGAR